MFGYKLNSENKVISLSGISSSKQFSILSSKYLVDYHFNGDSQCLPLYSYDEKGNRIDNITDWGLQQFHNHYCKGDSRIAPTGYGLTKLDIFHYTYAVLHNPVYRQKYEQNLKRDFPRIPFYENFQQWVGWGRRLMDLHINYKTIEPYTLKRIDIPSTKAKLPTVKLKADQGPLI